MKLLLIFIFLLWNLSTFSQSYFFKQYSVKQGLPQSQVNAILQDSRGLLWLGTAGGGVAVYDGSEFEVINEQNSLGGNIVTTIAEGPDGKIYVGSTWGGISVIENMNVSPLPVSEEYQTISADGIAVDEENRVWFYNFGGVYYFEDNKVEKITIDGVEDNFITKLSVSGKKVWASTQNKLIRIYPKSKTTKVVYESKQPITSFLINEADQICLGIENSGIKYLDSVWCSDGINQLNQLYPDINVIQMKKDLNEDLWIATNNRGIFKVSKGGKIIHYDKSNGLKTTNLQFIEVDDFNTLWIGTGGDGVLKYDDNPFISFDETEGFKRPDNFPFLKSSDGAMWVGNLEKGVFRLKDGKLTNISTDNGLPSNTCFALAEGNNGEIWIGTSKGLVKWKDRILDIIDEDDGLPISSIKSLAFNDELMYIGTNGGGLVEYDGSSMKVYNEAFGLVSLHVHSIHIRDNIVWFGTGGGLFKLHNGIIEKFSAAEGICNTYVGSIVSDKNGTIWVGTDRCVSSLIDGKFNNYNSENGLFSDVVYTMVSDDNGDVWVGSNLGLDKLVLDEKSQIVSVEHFGYNEGFRGVECNSQGGFKDDEGNLYFTTVGGVYKYVPHLDYNLNSITPVYLSSARIMGDDSSNFYSGKFNWFGVGDSMTIPFDRNYFSIKFKGVNLKNAKNLIYSYKLDGFDQMWLTTKNDEAIYSNIPPGNYTFRVSACPYGNCGNSNESVLYLKIEEPPVPFYLSTLAIIIYVIILLFVLFYFTIFRGIRLKRQNDLLEKRVMERTHKIFKQNEEKTIMLQEIHHRVKNNLQIINSLFNIQKRYTDSKEAIELFNSSQSRILAMAKIHEKLYESKDLSQVNVRSYVLDLISDIKENYKLDKNIILQIDIEEIEMKMDVLIPFALIINEIISNSFQYAFEGKANGIIDIRINQNKSGSTYVYIADNGSGFDRSVWENTGSMGMELIQTLADQIDAKIDVKSSEGTAYDIEFVI